MNTISNIATQAYKIANKISKSKFDEEEIIRIQAQQHALSSVKVSNKRKRPPLSSERNVRVGFADQEEISSSGSTVVVVV
jgi:hypothetical protein